jgi:hypothetical protein
MTSAPFMRVKSPTVQVPLTPTANEQPA